MTVLETEPSKVAMRGRSQPSRRPKNRLRWLGLVLARIAVVGAFLAIWQVVVSLGLVREFFISTPGEVIAAMIAQVMTPVFWVNVLSTFQATILGFVVGAILGIIFGLVLAATPLLNEILDPIITALNSMPRMALAPLFILWFGIGVLSKTMVAITLVVFVLLITTRSGVKNADPDLLLMARANGATRTQTFYKVVLPVSVPAIFSGLQLGLIYSLLSVVVAEIVGSAAGLGVLVSRYSQTFEVADAFAVLIIMALLATFLDLLMRMLESRLLRWQRP